MKKLFFSCFDEHKAYFNAHNFLIFGGANMWSLCTRLRLRPTPKRWQICFIHIWRFYDLYIKWLIRNSSMTIWRNFLVRHLVVKQNLNNLLIVKHITMLNIDILVKSARKTFPLLIFWICILLKPTIHTFRYVKFTF